MVISLHIGVVTRYILVELLPNLVNQWRFVRDNYTVMTDRLTHLMPRTEKIKDFSLRNFKELDGDIIPPNNFVVLNDHDNNQHDSRQFGLIDKKDIIGNISLRYYPFSKWTIQFKS